MIRPWYRSRLCWLGIPGLLFLLWAWASSNFTHRRLTLRAWELSSTQGKVLAWSMQSDIEHDFRLDYRTAEVAVETIDSKTLFFRNWILKNALLAEGYPIPPGEQCWFPAPNWRSVDYNPDTYYRLRVVPYWLLTGGYLALWAGALALWQRRKARLLKASAELPP